MKLSNKLWMATMAACLMTMPLHGQMNGHGAVASAANDPSKNGMGTGDSTSDASFLKKAEQSNIGEIAAGNLALSKSQNADVKSFAQKMIDDHTAMKGDVEAAAASMNVKLPTEPMKEDKAMAAKLQAMDGAAFDKAYMAGQVKDHKKTLMLMKTENNTTSNPALKDLTSKGSDKVAMHLKMAEELNAKVAKM